MELQQIKKNNNLVLDAILIHSEDTNICPTIYLEQYKGGVPDADVDTEITKILDTYESHKVPGKKDIKELIAQMKPTLQLVNLEKNKERFDENQVLYKPYMDLAVVVRFAKQTKDGTASFLASKPHLEHFGLDEDEVFEEAVENTRNDSFRFRGMTEIINEIVGDSEMHYEDEQMWVLSNQLGFNGSVAIYYAEKLAEISEKLDSDLIILPSSIHEVIILKSNEQIMDTAALKNMVHEVNTTQVMPDEILSDSVYLYKRDEQNLMKIA